MAAELNDSLLFESSTAIATTNAPLQGGDHPYIIFAREIYIWLVPIMCTVLLISVLGNCLIVLSAPFMGRSIGPYHRLCLSLAAADAWAGSLLITGLVVNSYMPVVMRVQKKSDCFAAILEIFRISGMLTSNFHIFVLSLNQFIGCVYPLKYKAIVTTRRLRCLILLLWLLPIAFVTTWFFSVPNEGFQNPLCRMRFYNRFPFRLSVFISFAVPLIGTFVFYGCICRSVLIAKAQTANKMRNDRRKVKSRMKLMVTTLLILSTFTLSWGVCVLYYVLVCENCLFVYLKAVSFHLGFLINATVNFLVAVKLLTNPLIYAYRLEHVRTSVQSFLRMIFLEFFLGKAAPIVKTKSSNLGLSRTTSGQSFRSPSSISQQRRRPPGGPPNDLSALIKTNSNAANAIESNEKPADGSPQPRRRPTHLEAEQTSLASSVE